MKVKIKHIQTKIHVVVSRTPWQHRTNQRLLRRFPIGRQGSRLAVKT